MNRFNSIGQIKEIGEFIPAGKIYPRRIIRSEKRRDQHKLAAGSNQWAFPTLRGYLIFVENHDGAFECAFKVKKTKGGWQGSPYSEGRTMWIGNYQRDEITALALFNRIYEEKNAKAVLT